MFPTAHCTCAIFGPVSSGGAEAGVKVSQAVVGSGRLGLGGDANVGSGGGTDRGGGGDGQDGYEGGLGRWGEDNVTNLILGTETNTPLASEH